MVECKECVKAKFHALKHDNEFTHVSCRAHRTYDAIMAKANSFNNPSRIKELNIKNIALTGQKFFNEVVVANSPTISILAWSRRQTSLAENTSIENLNLFIIIIKSLC